MAKRSIFFFIFLILATLLSTEMLLYSQNTLHLNGKWMGEKRNSEMGLAGSESFLFTRYTLARNLLNLSSWYGSQEATLLKEIIPQTMSVKFQLKEDAFFYLIFGKTNTDAFAIRISRSKFFGPAFIRMTHQGKFLEEKPFVQPELSGQWQRASVNFSQDSFTLYVNGQEVFSKGEINVPKGYVGFRAGYVDGVLVDDFTVTDRNGEKTADHFDNRKYYGLVFQFNFLVLLALSCLYMGLQGAQPGGFHFRRALLHGGLLNGMLAVCFLMLFTFDFFYWSDFAVDYISVPIPSEQKKWDKLRAEVVRGQVFDLWHSLATGKPVLSVYDIYANPTGGYPSNRIWRGPIYCRKSGICAEIKNEELFSLFYKKSAFRTLFIGTSQTVGVGAERLKDTFFARIHNMIAKDFNKVGGLESMNMSIAGVDAAKTLEEYKQVYLAYNPDVVVINLGYNDSRNAKFPQLMREFLEINKAKKIHTILVEEAMNGSVEKADDFSVSRNTLRDLGREFGAMVVPLQEYMNQPNWQKSGLLWWDNCHMTSYGQEVAADWLAPLIKKYALSLKGSHQKMDSTPL